MQAGMWPGLRHSTVSESVVDCWIEPDVAVTVIVEVTGVTPPPPPPPVPPPPQPESRAKPPAAIAISSTSWKPRRFFQPKMHSESARTVAGNSGREPRCRLAVSV